MRYPPKTKTTILDTISGTLHLVTLEGVDRKLSLLKACDERCVGGAGGCLGSLEAVEEDNAGVLNTTQLPTPAKCPRKSPA